MNVELTTLKADLKARLRIEDLIRSSGIELKKDGVKNLVGLCPWHNEKTGSFKVNIDEQFAKCFGCQKSADVFAWLSWMKFHKLDVDGSDFIDVLREGCRLAGIAFPEHKAHEPKPAKPKTIYATREKLDASAQWQASESGGKVVATYQYGADLIIYRIENQNDKRFLQAHPCTGGFCFGGLEKNPIYNRTRVAKAETVVIVEGEKCVHALHEISIVATTSPGGSSAAAKADWTPLAGKHVVIWRDNDAAGQKYQDDVLSALKALSPAPHVSIVNISPLELPAGGDCADFIERFESKAEKYNATVLILAEARGTGSVAELDADLADAVAGKRVAVPFAWGLTTDASLALLPGTVTILCGSPGATKSLALLQNIRHWVAAGVMVAALMLEDGSAYHLRRALAQIVGDSRVTRDDWCYRNAEQLKQYRAHADSELTALQPAIEAPEEKAEGLTCKALLQWMQKKADAGARVICIDPITAMTKGRFGHQDDHEFMFGAKSIVAKAKASLLLITHPRKSPMAGKAPAFSMDDMAGGADYQRFAQAILLLRAHESREILAVESAGAVVRQSNRTMQIMKSRNSYGQSLNYKIAFHFDSDDLTLRELGKIADS